MKNKTAYLSFTFIVAFAIVMAVFAWFSTDGVEASTDNNEAASHIKSEIVDAKAGTIPNTKGRYVSWSEVSTNGNKLSFYAISQDGESYDVVRETGNKVKLRYAEFDPLREVPFVNENLVARNTSRRPNAYIVQFHTQSLPEFQEAVEQSGGKIFNYVHDNAYIVQMNSAAFDKVQKLGFVRWVGSYEPAYKIDPEILDSLHIGSTEPIRYNIMVLERGSRMQNSVESLITKMGGNVVNRSEQGFRLEADLNHHQLAEIAKSEDILYIDRWSAPESDMNIVREVGGANMLETVRGYRGEGVRGEVLDNGLRQTHTDFNSGLRPIIHNSANTNEPSNHGTSTYGIVFGRGTTNISGRGMLPEGQGIFADYELLSDRYAHTARLNQEPYEAVFQSNSWGSALTTSYNTIAAEFDDILFINDILVLNSQSNAGSRSSRPQAWSKNVVSIGGIRHYGTASLTDDRWASGASIGPASDGRLKPELAHFYDAIYTTSNSSDTSYTTSFGGTSAATPITAGHFGLFYQMWHNGEFGNPTAGSVFKSRPHMTTAKAIMINTAVQWDMNIAGTDITRVRQGFGRASIQNLYDLREKMLIVDEADPLTALQTKTYSVTVPAGSSDPLKITMVYADPMGNPTSAVARVNDVDLKVTSPDGKVFRGNNGLGVGQGMWSTEGGNPNTVDTVENVFIQNPTAGVWQIEIRATEINADARVETPGVLDVDFALVASGISNAAQPQEQVSIDGRVVDASGRGIGGTVVTATVNGTVLRYITGPFGYYRFEGIAGGSAVTLTATAKRRQFQTPTVTVTPMNNISGINFTALP